MFKGGRVVLCLAWLRGCARGGSPSPTTADTTARTPHDGLPALPADIRLIGLGSGDLDGLLGRPALVRSERQAQYRRYSLAPASSTCFSMPSRRPARRESCISTCGRPAMH